MRRVAIYMLGLLAVLLAGCGGASPSVEVVTGELLYEADFSTAGLWESGSAPEATIGVDAGVYRMRTATTQYVRGFDAAQRYENIVLEVDVLQLSGAAVSNGYGVICRGSLRNDSASGYYFLIGGDGSYSIREGRAGDLHGLVKWARSDAVGQGIARNRLRVVCADDVLALYVNGELVAETRDGSSEAGYAGFVAVTEEGSVTEVEFDNLRIWAAMIDK